jgi:hypothetical protein
VDQDWIDSAGPVYFVLMSVGLLIWGIVLTVQAWRFQLRSVLTIGTVKGWQPRRNSDARTNYAQHPIVEYRSRDGRVHEFVAEVLGNDEKLPIGTPLKVRYDSLAPESARRANEFIVFGGPVALVLCSVLMLAGISGLLGPMASPADPKRSTSEAGPR